MNIQLQKTIDHNRRETTIKATDAAGNEICSETWVGTGGRVAIKLAQHVRISAEQRQLVQRNTGAAVGSATRQLASRQ